jgi:hypothetical protein
MRVHGFSRERLGQLNNWWTPSATGVGTDPKPLNRGLLTTRGGIRSRYLALVASGNLCRPKTLTLARTNRWHCPLGAHLSRHIRDAAGLGVGSGPVASRLALSWPDLLGAVAGPIKEATSHCLLWSSGSGAGSGVTSTICRSTRPSPAGWFPVVCLHRDRSPQPSSACRALAVPPPGLVPEQLSDRLQAGEPCFARLIGFLLRVLALYPPASNAHVNIIAAIRLTLSFL